MTIHKLIIPAAGLGTRFLPITKSIPKEMLPIANKPAIEYVVQEGYDAGITDIQIVLSPEKKSISDYFTHNQILETTLAEKQQINRLDKLNKLIDHVNFSYSYQHKPAGLADALWQSRHFIADTTYFAVALPDDIIFGNDPELQNLIKTAQDHKGMVIAVQTVPDEMVSSYGIVSIAKKIDPEIYAISSLIEKPSKESAPSNLAIVGRYIFHHDIFDFIKKTPLHKQGEILLPETINLMIEHNYPVFAYLIKGKRFDTGTPAGWAQCVAEHYRV